MTKISTTRLKTDPLRKVWDHMRQRCKNPNHPKFKHYGGRGIVVCREWESFAQFEADVGPHPGKGWTFDRRDNNDGYHKGNVRWASFTTQNRNRNYTKLTAEDAAKIRRLYPRRTKRQLSTEFGVSWSQIHRIIRNEAWA